MKKQYKSSIFRNQKIKKNIYTLRWCSLTWLLSLFKLFLDCVPEKNPALWENQVTNDA